MAGPGKKKSSTTASQAPQKAPDRFRIELVFERLPANPERRNRNPANGGAPEKFVTIALEGVILQQEAAIVQKCLDAVLLVPFSKLILDLSRVPVISQRGIEVLLRMRNKLKKRGRVLEIHGLQSTVRLTLKELGLGKTFVL